MPETETSVKDKLDEVLGLIARGRWYILSATGVTALVTVAALYQLPNSYTSEATLFVVQQQVPQRYVTPTNTTDLADALPAMTQEVLSTSRMLDLVEQFNLFPAKRRLAPEVVVGLMRQYINIEPLPPSSGHRDSNAFKISFTASKAVLAQEVTSKLTSLFIQENLRTREDQAKTTNTFLADRLEIARQKLAQQEDVLRDFKTKYLGELPEQQQGNLAILSGAQQQLQNISSSIDRAQQQRAYLESLISGYRRLASRGTPVAIPGAPTPAGPRAMTPYQSIQNELERLQGEKEKMLLTYRPKHPDVVAIEHAIANTRALAEKLKPQTAASTEDTQTKDTQTKDTQAHALSTPSTLPVPSTEAEEDSSVAQLRSQLESNRVEIANLSKDEIHQKEIIDEYQRRLNLTPVREQELTGILRDYELSKQDYSDLLGKEQQSQLAMSLEKRQGGQQFRLVEPPSLPALPSSPKRLKMSFAGVGGGLFLGLVGAVLVEVKNRAFHTERQLSAYFSVPLVVSLPRLVSRKEQRRRKWRTALELTCATVLVSAVLIAEAWVYRHP